jgi:CTP:molybdopterin cytidylyltransferase MocA
LRIERVRTVVLAGGRSRRMGFDKLTALFDGVPLARRVALNLRELRPLFVATPAVADVISDLRFVRLVLTQPTAGPAMTLALAHAAIRHDLHIAVLPCDLPFLDAALVAAVVGRVPDDADLSWPVVKGTPGHPVLWSPKARTRIPALSDDDAPASVRHDAALRVAPLEERDDAYVTDVDTPDAWAVARARAAIAAARR